MSMMGTTKEGGFSRARALGGALLCGGLFALVWNHSAPDFARLFAVLNVVFFGVAALLILSLRGWPGIRTCRRLTQPSPWIAAVTFLVFAGPVSAATLSHRWKVLLDRDLRPESLFGAGNPLGLAPDTLEYFRTGHPPRRRLLVEPNRPQMVGIYAPVYVMPLLGNVGADMEQLQLGREGRHPVYNQVMLGGTPDLGSVRAFLDEKRIAHLLGTGAFAPAFVKLASQDPSDFAVRFRSGDGSDVVLEYLEALKPR